MGYLVEHTKKLITLSKSVKDSTPDSLAKLETSLNLLWDIERMLRTLRGELRLFNKPGLYEEVSKLITTSNKEFSS
jgi:predicted component of type VI protein secretion system